MRFSDRSILGFVLLFGATAAGGQTPAAAGQCIPLAAATFHSISKAEVELLLADVAKTNPQALKKFEDDPELKKTQLGNLRELLAFSQQAVTDGYAKDPTNCTELENIKNEVVAVNYDKELNKNKGPMPPFGFISQARVDAFWKGLNSGEAAKRESDFDRFMAAKVALLKASNPDMADRTVTPEEEDQARDFYAKIQIYSNEYERKSAIMPKSLRDKVQLQVKLQQAQFLARRYSETLATKVKASDQEVATYIRSHPEFDPAVKRAKAEQILQRAKGGEDFAKLADEFSDDPGTEGKGGLYADVRPGQMVEPFEKAALSTEPGSVYATLAETDFGYHIIKLEKKGVGNSTYDVRHILVSTMYKDPTDPSAREIPIGEYARKTLEAERERKVTDEIVAANNISVPDDFTIPVAAAKNPPAKTSAGRTRKRPVRRK